jgi:hypothetical protein
MWKFGNNLDFNNVILTQLFATFRLVITGAFDSADQLFYLRLFYFQFILSLNDHTKHLQISVNAREVFASYSREFYSEKYLPLFESQFDLDQMSDIIYLQEVVTKLETAKSNRPSEENRRNGEALVNKAIHQHLTCLFCANWSTQTKEFAE